MKKRRCAAERSDLISELAQLCSRACASLFPLLRRVRGTPSSQRTIRCRDGYQPARLIRLPFADKGCPSAVAFHAVTAEMCLLFAFLERFDVHGGS